MNESRQEGVASPFAASVVHCAKSHVIVDLVQLAVRPISAACKVGDTINLGDHLERQPASGVRSDHSHAVQE
jgi:hypothetical protein